MPEFLYPTSPVVGHWLRRCLCGIAGLICFVAPLQAQWPQFRGPNCRGVSEQSDPLPVKFSDTENVAWKASVGDGIGCPVVAGGRVFVSGMTADQTVSLFAFDLKTGDELWRRDWETGPLPEIHNTNSHASSTPAADDDRVYFYFPTLGLHALDAASGEPAWQQPLPTPFFVFKWGAGMSPVLYRDLVVFCQDDDLHPAIYAFDRATGKLRWKDEREDMAVNYSHPVHCTVDGHDELVVAGTGMLIGYDPDTGRRRWHAKVLLRNIKTTPVVIDGSIYLSVQSGGIANQWLASVDRAETGNNDGKLSRDEVQRFMGEEPIPDAFFRKTFGRGDRNGDGILEGEELDAAFLHPANFAGATFDTPSEDAGDEYVMAVRGGGRGDVTETHLKWRHPTRHTDHIVSPFVSDGRMFLITEGGISTVFGMPDGQPQRRPTRVGRGGTYFASPVGGDGKIYLANDRGDVVVLKDGPGYEELQRNRFGESIVATPAIADGSLLFRTRTALYCISEPAASGE